MVPKVLNFSSNKLGPSLTVGPTGKLGEGYKTWKRRLGAMTLYRHF